MTIGIIYKADIFNQLWFKEEKLVRPVHIKIFYMAQVEFPFRELLLSFSEWNLSLNNWNKTDDGINMWIIIQCLWL